MPGVWKRLKALCGCFSCRPDTEDDEQVYAVSKEQPVVELVVAPPPGSLPLSQDSIDPDKLSMQLGLDTISLIVNAGTDYELPAHDFNLPSTPGMITVDNSLPSAHQDAADLSIIATNNMPTKSSTTLPFLNRTELSPLVSPMSRRQSMPAITEEAPCDNRSLQAIIEASLNPIATHSPPLQSQAPSDPEDPPWGFARSQNKRSSMEDFLDVSEATMPDGQILKIYTVLDGHNGCDAAMLAMEGLPYHLQTRLNQGFQTALLRAFAATERALYREFLQDPTSLGGTTALVIIHTPTTLHVANLGDCRAVLGRTVDGVHSVVDLTNDHKPHLEQARGVERLQGEVLFRDDGGWYLSREDEYGDVQRIGVSRALADFDMPALKYKASNGQWAGPLSNIPELTEHLIQDTDELVILASDGLWDKVDSQQAVALARSHLKHQGTTAESCAKMLMDTAMQQGSLDNITVIVVQLADMQRSNAADAADTRPPHLKNRFKAPASAL